MKKVTLSVVFLVKIFLILVVASLAGNYVPYKGNFPYKEITASYGLSAQFTSLANFDGAHYLNISREGYHQYDQAFFPLYPLFIRYSAMLFAGNHLIAGLVISNIAALLGVLLLYEILKHFFDAQTAFIAAIFFLLYPASFFLNAVYTEGLFLFLITAGLYSIIAKHNWYGAIFGFLSGITRLVGIGCGILSAWVLRTKLSPFAKNHGRKSEYESEEFFASKGFRSLRSANLRNPERKLDGASFAKHINLSALCAVMAPLAGLLTYMFYLYKTTGDPLFFLTVQSAFNLNRSDHVILLPQVYVRYFRIFITAARDVVYGVAFLEFALFNLMLLTALALTYRGYIQKKNPELFFGIFSLFNLLLPTLTGTLLSIPRFGIFSFASFIFFAQIKNIYLQYILSGIFVMLQIIMLSLFVQGYFIS